MRIRSGLAALVLLCTGPAYAQVGEIAGDPALGDILGQLQIEAVHPDLDAHILAISGVGFTEGLLTTLSLPEQVTVLFDGEPLTVDAANITDTLILAPFPENTVDGDYKLVVYRTLLTPLDLPQVQYDEVLVTIAHPLTGPVGPEGPRGPRGLVGKTGPQGDQGVRGPVGARGPRGTQGVGVHQATVTEEGDLILTLTNETTINAGHAVGPVGPQGPKGSAGPRGDVGNFINNWRHRFDASEVYERGDLVLHKGSSWLKARWTRPEDGAPGTVGSGWVLVARAGARGPSGPKGDTGPAGLQGPKGDQGVVGPAGVDGKDGAQGPAGADGKDGAQGPAGADGEDGVGCSVSACTGTFPTGNATLTCGTNSIDVPCMIPGKYVFITSQTWTGNLDGLAGADAKCQASAGATGLSGTYKAWLSGTDESPAISRFARSTVPYYKPNGEIVANDWDDLTDGSLISSIGITEAGVEVQEGPLGAWTNTSPDGLSEGARYSCQNWSDASDSAAGSIGVIGTDSSWTSTGVARGCNTLSRLYCFEQ